MSRITIVSTVTYFAYDNAKEFPYNVHRDRKFLYGTVPHSVTFPMKQDATRPDFLQIQIGIVKREVQISFESDW